MPTPAPPAGPKTAVLFVCSGNICRSPMAEGMLRALAAEAGIGALLHIDSAGTHGFHRGEAPDPRAQRVMAARGIDISRQRARPVVDRDFGRFDHILAMTREHVGLLFAQCHRTCTDASRCCSTMRRARSAATCRTPTMGRQRDSTGRCR